MLKRGSTAAHITDPIAWTAKKYAVPVAGLLIEGLVDGVIGKLRVGIPSECLFGYSAGIVGPHVHERTPAEKLYETDSPEYFGGFYQQMYAVGFLLFLLIGYAVVGGIFSGWHFLHLKECIGHTSYEDSCSSVE